MGGLNSKQIADIKKGKTTALTITSQRKEKLHKRIYNLSNTDTWNVSNNFLSSLSPKISSINLTSLNLSSNEFTHFPKELFSLITLVHLDLSFNLIDNLPSDIQQLTNLSDLDLSFNKMIFLPSELGKIAALKRVKITNNTLEVIPETLLNALHLQYLNLSHNNITTFPKKHALPSLEDFNLAANHITQVPPTFLLFSSLQKLTLSRNNISSFPPVNTLPNPKNTIKEIYINNNHMKELTNAIYQLHQLEVLDVKSNELKLLPNDLFVHSPNIRHLDISFNPDYRWGLGMPNAFAETIMREIHLTKGQRLEEKLQDITATTPNSSPSGSPSNLPLDPSQAPSPLVNASTPPPPSLITPSTPSPLTPLSPSSPSPLPSPLKDSQESLSGEAATPSSSTPPPLPPANPLVADNGADAGAAGGTDELKKKHSKHIRKYIKDQKKIRVVEHDFSGVDKGIPSHAAHLAELMVWSGPKDVKVAEEIAKVLQDVTCIRPGYCAHDREALMAKNITHILSVGSELSAYFPDEFEYHLIRVRDNSITDDLSLHFPICQKFIESGRKKGGVLVHCAAGVSRSASVIMAYLMWSENITFAQARKELKTLRPIVKSNFYLQLEYYHHMLRNQSKRKAKLKKPKRPKLQKTTSLPTIEALHKIKMDQFVLEPTPISSSPPVTLPPINGKALPPTISRSVFARRPTIASAKEALKLPGEVPLIEMQEAADFEELSEIHKLMRVHSLPDVHSTIRKSTGKSFLKVSKI